MIEAEDVEPSRPGLAPAADVIVRIDEEPRCRLIRDVARPEGLDDLVVAPEEQPAALVWRRLAGMTQHVIERGVPSHFHFELRTSYFRLSITMAIPIPPPMHNDATP